MGQGALPLGYVNTVLLSILRASFGVGIGLILVR